MITLLFAGLTQIAAIASGAAGGPGPAVALETLMPPVGVGAEALPVGSRRPA
jgi:hypothetical protein